MKRKSARKIEAPETRGDRNIRWIEANLQVPDGTHHARPVVLREWQRDIVRGIYDTPTRRGIISFGRKNGKTALAAFLLLLHLCGPEARPNSQLFSAAMSRDQASVLFGLAAKMVRMSLTLSPYVTVRDTAKQLYCGDLGTLYRALSADASTAYGLSPVFIVHDELGQVKGPRHELYEALETATGAQQNPLSLIISTQAPTDADLLSVLIDDAKSNADPRVKVWLYSAPMDAEPFTEDAIRLANPAFGDFQNTEETLAMAADASRMPSREPEYRNLILNQRVEASSPFISRTIWAANGMEPLSLEDADVYGGLDLSTVSDLTALVLGARLDGHWHIHPTFWLPKEGLREKSAKDRVPYDTWASQGHLVATPGRSVDYEYVAHWLFDLENRLRLKKLAFDRWNFRNLRPWLVKAGFSEARIDELFVEVGQGMQTMSPALRDLEAELLNARMCHGMHPVLTMCAANAVVQMDPAGNRKLTKAKSSGRIDGMVALAMMMAVAPELDKPAVTSFWDAA